MVKEEFLQLLVTYDRGLQQILLRMERNNPRLELSIDRQILLYCGRQLKLAEKVVPEYLEISSHVARCFMEIELILSWLKKDSENYNIFIADAEFAQLDLTKSKKDSLAVHAPEYEEKFKKMIVEIQKNIEEKGHAQYREKRSLLYKIKDLAFKIDEKFGVLFGAKFDYFSKMSHPTAWFITRHPDEDVYIRSEAMAEINKSLIFILNRLDDSYPGTK